MILVALGANLPAADGTSPLETCERAAASLDGMAGLRCVALSRWFATSPVPPSGQPPYINGLARLDGWVEPERLLAELQRVEAAHGRQRSVPNAARTLDLDIVAMGALVRTAPDPVVPHPRMHERAFVLAPLLDVAPEWLHPVLGLGAGALLAALPDQGVRPLPNDACLEPSRRR